VVSVVDFFAFALYEYAAMAKAIPDKGIASLRYCSPVYLTAVRS